MINNKNIKDDGKKLYVSDEELCVDELYSKTVEFLHGHVYWLNEYKDTQHTDGYRAECYQKWFEHREKVRKVIMTSHLTTDERFVMIATYLYDDYPTPDKVAERTGYTKAEVTKYHAKGFVKAAKKLQQNKMINI